MKVFNFYEQINHPEFCYNTVHMHGGLSTVLDCTATSLDEATHLLLLDVPRGIDRHVDEFISFRNNGGKIILMTFDPFNFLRVDSYIQCNMLDMVVVFDQQFKTRFNIKTYVTDYFFNQGVFPTSKDSYNNSVCIFGHIINGRINKYNLPRVDVGMSSYESLYNKVQKFNGVAVFDDGYNEYGTEIVRYNKAKAVETLMCGRNPYCMPGINTVHYNDYLKKYEDILTPMPVEFFQEDIFKINQQVLELLRDEITNL